MVTRLTDQTEAVTPIHQHTEVTHRLITAREQSSEQIINGTKQKAGPCDFPHVGEQTERRRFDNKKGINCNWLKCGSNLDKISVSLQRSCSSIAAHKSNKQNENQLNVAVKVTLWK